MIYGYARVSTDRQDNSLEAQSERLMAYIKESGLEFGEIFVDRDQSAFRLPLTRRREGKRLCDTLKQGDTVVATKIDRCFRSLQDQCNQLTRWDSQGIQYVILDLPMQLQTPYGRLTLNVLGATAQLASELTGMRVREVCSYLRSQGRPYGGGRPFGWLRKSGEYVPCEKERDLGSRVLAMHADGISYEAICLTLAREGVRKPQTRKGSAGWYALADVWNLARAARAGYPRVPPGVSPSDWLAETQREEAVGASQPAPGA
jgi:DNA invertase Pin-like site-specific DNA recombinase